MDDSQEHNSEGGKPDTKEGVLCDIINVKAERIWEWVVVVTGGGIGFSCKAGDVLFLDVGSD